MLTTLIGIALMGHLKTGPDLLANGRFEGPLKGNWSVPRGSLVEPSDGQVPGNILHIPFGDPPHGYPYEINAQQVSQGGVKKGDTLFLQGWMRSADRSEVGITFEEGPPSYPKLFRTGFGLTPEWKEYRTAVVAPKDYPPGQFRLTFYLGFGRGSVDFADVRLTDEGLTPLTDLPLTKEYFAGRNGNDESWKPAALARIEKYRKGDLTISVTDAQGNPVPNASIDVQQTQHAFHFGTAVHANLILQQNSDGDHYRQMLLEMFNTVVFEGEMKWYRVSGQDYTQTDQAIDWLLDHHFWIRAHNLIWGGFGHMPPEVKAAGSINDTMSLLRDRVTGTVSRFKGKVYVWDVINEPFGQTDLWNRIGYDKIGQILQWAHQTDPSVKLALNEFDLLEEASSGSENRRRMESLVPQLKAEGAPLDTIGLQCHIRVPLTTIPRVLQILDELDALGVHVEITEFDVTVPDDQVHGDYVRDYLIAAFSHPNIKSFVVWGFWAGAKAFADLGAAMINKDWSLRPAAQNWIELVKHVWWTHSEGKTDGSGTYRCRAFYGKYAITVNSGGVKKTVAANFGRAEDGSVTVRLP